MRFQGNVPLEAFSRLSELVILGSAEIVASLDFSINDRGRKLILGQVTAKLRVPCQRCLEPVAIEVLDDISLSVVQSDAEAALFEEKLGKEYDPLISSDERLSLVDIVEDQLLLAMPIASYHDDASCAATPCQSDAEPAADETHRPFANLAQLIAKHDN